MKIRIVLIAAAAVLTLGACKKSEAEDAAAVPVAATPSAAAAATAAPASAPASEAAAAAAAGSAPTKAFMVGKWAEEGQCADLPIEFKADGSMVGPFDRWELDDGVLTMVGNPSKMHLSVVDPNTMQSRLDGADSPRKLVRCK